MSLDELGSGEGRARSGEECWRVHVPGALVGERLLARLAHVSVHADGGEREAWAELVSLLAPSPDRVAPDCAACGECGSCALMALAYHAQLAWKRERVQAQLVRYPVLAGISAATCVPSPETTHYRNQAKYVYGRDPTSGHLVLGAYAPRSHRLVDLEGCRVIEPQLEDARLAMIEILAARRVEPFDEQRRTGILRYVVMRENAAGKVMVTLVAARRDWVEAPAIASAIAAACSAVAGVVLNVNPTGGNRILGEEERSLWGLPYLEDRVGGVTVRLASRSFSQANRAVAACIYRDIVAAGPAQIERAVDAYAGAAPIALSLATVATEVVAIEENRAATAAAAAFIARLADASSVVRVVTGDAARCLEDVHCADFVVLDPPRKGCAKDVLAAIGHLRPQGLAYLSCDPATLARDLAVLVAGGARLLRVTPYDMLPHTPHVETLALLAYDAVAGEAGVLLREPR